MGRRVTDDAPADYLTFLRDLNAEVARRNQAGARDHPGMLVLLEEATAFRAGLNKPDQDESDRLLRRVG